MLEPAIHFMPALSPDRTVMTARFGTSRKGKRKTCPSRLVGGMLDKLAVIMCKSFRYAPKAPESTALVADAHKRHRIFPGVKSPAFSASLEAGANR